MPDNLKKAAKPAFYLLLLGLVALMPWLNKILPGVGFKPYTIRVLTLAMAWATAAVSLNLVLGYTGQACLAHGAFLGIGSYAFGIFVERVGLNFWLSLLIAGLGTALLGFLIGLPSLRTKGPYFAIVTLCFNVIVFKVFENWTWLSGGVRGQNVPIPSFLEQRWARYYFALAVLVLALVAVRLITKSILGITLMSIRSNENLSEAVGINTFRYKLLSLTVSCFIVAMAGVVLAVENGHLDFTITNYAYSFNMLIYVLIGGAATLSGPVVGAVGLYYLLENLEKWVKEWRYVIFGLLLLLVVIYFPRGVAGGVEQLWKWIKGQPWKRRAQEVTG